MSLCPRYFFLRLTFHIGTIVTIFLISQYLWSNKSMPRTLQVLKRQGRMRLCGVYVLTREDRRPTYSMDIPFVSIHIRMPDKWPFFKISLSVFFFFSVCILLETLNPRDFPRVIWVFPPRLTPDLMLWAERAAPQALSLHPDAGLLSVPSASVTVWLLWRPASLSARPLCSDGNTLSLFSAALEATEVILLPTNCAELQESQEGLFRVCWTLNLVPDVNKSCTLLI